MIQALRIVYNVMLPIIIIILLATVYLQQLDLANIHESIQHLEDIVQNLDEEMIQIQ